MASRKKVVDGAEVKMQCAGNQSGFTSSDGSEYEVDADGTVMIDAAHVGEAESHGFVVVPHTRATKAK